MPVASAPSAVNLAVTFPFSRKLTAGPYGEKQGTVETFMVDAAKAGAKFLVGAQVDRLLFCRPDQPTPTTITDSQLHMFYPNAHRTKSFGALLTLQDGSKAVVIASKSVVVSGGSINSPAILLRSKLRNPNIGRNLHLHPCTYVTACFDEQINPWEGAIMTAVGSSIASTVDIELKVRCPMSAKTETGHITVPSLKCVCHSLAGVPLDLKSGNRVSSINLACWNTTTA